MPIFQLQTCARQLKLLTENRAIIPEKEEREVGEDDSAGDKYSRKKAQKAQKFIHLCRWNLATKSTEITERKIKNSLRDLCVLYG
jgi:hypothetical protein